MALTGALNGAPINAAAINGSGAQQYALSAGFALSNGLSAGAMTAQLLEAESQFAVKAALAPHKRKTATAAEAVHLAASGAIGTAAPTAAVFTQTIAGLATALSAVSVKINPALRLSFSAASKKAKPVNSSLRLRIGSESYLNATREMTAGLHLRWQSQIISGKLTVLSASGALSFHAEPFLNRILCGRTDAALAFKVQPQAQTAVLYAAAGNLNIAPALNLGLVNSTAAQWPLGLRVAANIRRAKISASAFGLAVRQLSHISVKRDAILNADLTVNALGVPLKSHPIWTQPNMQLNGGAFGTRIRQQPAKGGMAVNLEALINRIAQAHAFGNVSFDPKMLLSLRNSLKASSAMALIIAPRLMDYPLKDWNNERVMTVPPDKRLMEIAPWMPHKDGSGADDIG